MHFSIRSPKPFLHSRDARTLAIAVCRVRPSSNCRPSNCPRGCAAAARHGRVRQIRSRGAGPGRRGEAAGTCCNRSPCGPTRAGNFLLDGLDPLADLRLRQNQTTGAPGLPSTRGPVQEKEVKLVLNHSNNVVLCGRVLDSSGKPIPARRCACGRKHETRLATPGARTRSRSVAGFPPTDKFGRFTTQSGVACGRRIRGDRALLQQAQPGRTGWLKVGRRATGGVRRSHIRSHQGRGGARARPGGKAGRCRRRVPVR